MGNYKKIDDQNLARLNNAEYLAFMNRTIDLATKGGGATDAPEEVSLEDGVPELGLTKEFLDVYKGELLTLADVVNESRASQETKRMSLHDANRDNFAVYILTRILRASTLPLEAERDAGKFLHTIVKPYSGISRLPVSQKTATMRGLLMDLRKAENSPHVTTLGLDMYLTELEKENDAYDKLAQQRIRTRAAAKKESGAALRKRIDVYYDDLTMLAQSYSVAHPSEKAATFVAALNQLIAETTAAYSQRIAQGKREPTDSPEEV